MSSSCHSHNLLVLDFSVVTLQFIFFCAAMWLERLRAVSRGEVCSGKQEPEVSVNEELLLQLVAQGFERYVFKRATVMAHACHFILTSSPIHTISLQYCAGTPRKRLFGRLGMMLSLRS
jgi:hypothetical protein